MHCVSFDSPGAGLILNQLNLLAKNCFSFDVENALKSLDITVYLSNQNAVNSTREHVGNLVDIDVLNEIDISLIQKIMPLSSHPMERILSFFKLHPQSYKYRSLTFIQTCDQINRISNSHHDSDQFGSHLKLEKKETNFCEFYCNLFIIFISLVFLIYSILLLI